MKNSKGVVELQFNWMFTLIAGALILLFFSTVVVKLKTTSDSSRNLAILKSMGSIAIGSESSPGTINILELPETEIEFGCNVIRVGKSANQFENMVVFAPRIVRTPTVVVNTLEWGIPYRVSNFVFISSPEVRYFLVGDTNLRKFVNESMPASLLKELENNHPLTIKNRDNYNVRFVYFDNFNPAIDVPPPSLKKMGIKDVTALHINGDLQKGEIRFYEKTKSNTWSLKDSTYYLGPENLLGAVYADDSTNFKCVRDNGLRKGNIVTNIYEQRSDELETHYGTDLCSDFYFTAKNDFLDVSTQLGLLTRSALTTSVALAVVNQINAAGNSLEDMNKQAQLHSCPLIY